MKIIKNKYTPLPQEITTPTTTPYPNYQQTHHKHLCTCGCNITLYDKHHDEDFCLRCGKVQQHNEYTTSNLVYGSYSTDELYTGTGYTRSEKEFMAMKGIRTKTFFNQGERNNMDYKYFIDTVKDELWLTSYDIMYLWELVRLCGGVHRLHSRLGYEGVLLGVCRYILLERGIDGYRVNLSNKLYKRYDVTRQACLVIFSNIEKNKVIKECPN